MIGPPHKSDFRAQLAAASAIADARARLEELARLASQQLGYVDLIQLDRVLERGDRAPVDGFATLRLALLATGTADHLLPAIRVAGLRRKLRIQTYVGAFGQYRQEILDPASGLQRFAADVVLLSLSPRQFIAGIALDAPLQEVEGVLAGRLDELRGLWRAAREHGKAGTVIQQTFLDVAEPLFGSFDRAVPGAPSRLVARLNDLAAQAAQEEQVLLLDVARQSARDGIDAWFDVARWLQGKMEIAPPAAQAYGELVGRVLGAQRGLSRKCLVLDLDNTLWGGVVGDVGTAGIVLGEGSAAGEAFLALQHYARSLKERGILLAVCSKNEAATAEAAFRDHPEMVLKRSDFAAFVANWNDKAENLRLVAEQLNLGLDSLVFVDDNPVERERIRASLPMVAVPELPSDPALYVRCIANAGYFEAVSFTRDDRQRAQQYAANAERDALRGASQSLDQFLQGLQMSVEFGPVDELNLARATQLINKTNQFNTTGWRCSADEVARIAADMQNETLQFRLIDRFGDNGLVSVMILRPDACDRAALSIDAWVMSCRVFGRQLEDEALNIAVESARRRGVRTLHAAYVRTDRNGVIGTLYEKRGFERSPPRTGDSEHVSRWTLDIGAYRQRPTYITRKHPEP